MKTQTLATFAAVAASLQGAVAHSWNYSPPFDCPGKTPPHHCLPKQHEGFDWKDLVPGPFDHYGGFDFSGFTCNKFFGRGSGGDVHPRTFGSSKFISGVAHSDKSKCPKIHSKSVDKFSITRFKVTVEFDCDLEFHYTLPNGSQCKQKSHCKKSGTTINNDQCGGATDVTIVLPKPPRGHKDNCNVDIHTIDFDCPTTTSSIVQSTTTSPAETTPAEPDTTETTEAGPDTTAPVETTPAGPDTTAPAETTPAEPDTTETTEAGPDTTSPPEITEDITKTTDSSPETTAPVETTPAETTPAEPDTTETTEAGPDTTAPVETTPAEPDTTAPVETTPAEPDTTETTEAGPDTTSPPDVTEDITKTTDSSPETTAPPNTTDAPGTVVTTVVTDVTVTTCPVTKTHVVSGITSIETSLTTRTLVITTTKTVCDQCTEAPQPPQTTSDSSPDNDLPCPEILPQCIKTWLPAECESNSDTACFCPKPEFTDKLFECLAAHGATDEEIDDAAEYFQGICAPYVPTNPGIVTGGPPKGTDVKTHTVPVTTITVHTTVTAPCEPTGTETVTSYTLTTISTEITVPQVTLTTTTGEVVIVTGPATVDATATPNPTPIYTTAPEVPGVPTAPAVSEVPVVPTVPGVAVGTGTGAFPVPTSTTPPFISGANRKYVGAGFLGTVMAVAVVLV